MASSASSPATDGSFELVKKKLTVETLEKWVSFTLRLCRLAFKRRQWGHLGQWLKAIKAGERVDNDGTTGSSSRSSDRRASRR